MVRCAFRLLALGFAGLLLGCHGRPDPRQTNFEIKSGNVTANYDNKTGHLKKLSMDLDKNGVIDTWTYMDGTRIDRIEMDKNEDGKIDRWEHYADGKLTSIGTSTRGDGVEDQWTYQTAQGLLDRVETDTDRDGKIDKWERYEASPEPGRPPVLRVVESEPDASGHPMLRLLYRPDGSFDRAEKLGAGRR